MGLACLAKGAVLQIRIILSRLDVLIAQYAWRVIRSAKIRETTLLKALQESRKELRGVTATCQAFESRKLPEVPRPGHRLQTRVRGETSATSMI